MDQDDSFKNFDCEQGRLEKKKEEMHDSLKSRERFLYTVSKHGKSEAQKQPRSCGLEMDPLLDDKCLANQHEKLLSMNDSDNELETLKKEVDKLQNSLKSRGESLLLLALKHGNSDFAKRLLSRNLSGNCMDDNQNLPIDYAWINQFYDVVLLLLKSDSKFPEKFNLDQLDGDDSESAKTLKNFVEGRLSLHQSIKEGNLEQVQKLLDNKSNLKLYLNVENRSASYTALKTKNTEIYAFLNSIGAGFLDDSEKKVLDELGPEHKVALKNALISSFPPVPGGHVHYLISKSRSQKPVEKLEEKLKKFYSELNQIPEISTILKVIQFSDYLDIIYDFDEENVAAIDPTLTKDMKGISYYNEGRLCIAASPKRGEGKVLGTIAHEIAHMTMQLLFENDCKPYSKTDISAENFFERIKHEHQTNFKNVPETPFQIFENIKKAYDNEDYHCEIIVTVPQILAEYKNGREWLQSNASELFDFFTETIIPKCQKFISGECYAIKNRKNVKQFNEILGAVTALEKSNIVFKNVDTIIDIINCSKVKIFIVRTKYTFLGLSKVLQSIFKEDYIHLHDKYMAISCKKFNSKLVVKDAMKTFYAANACDILIVQVSHDVHEKELRNFYKYNLSELFDHKPNKKIIFIVHPNVEEVLFRILKEQQLWNLCKNRKDGNTSLADLSEKSTTKLLQCKIKFQGITMPLKKLIHENEGLYEIITGNVIENLLEEKNIQIGAKIFDYSNLGTKIGYVGMEINLRSFVHEFKKQDDIFVIKGFADKEELLVHFNGLISEGLIKYQTIANQIQTNDSESVEIVSKKRVLLTQEISDETFKEICHQNSSKPIFLINFENNKKIFMLEQFYNPHLYLERKFKIVINRFQLEKLIDEFRSAHFILIKQSHDIKLKKTYPNVQIVESAEAEAEFDASINKQDKIVHLFFLHEEDEIRWNKSSHSGCCSNSWLNFMELKTNDQFLIEECDFIKHATYRKVIIIAGNPGMGKSTTLTKLYESNLIASSHWVIRINLKEYIVAIQKIQQKDLNIETIIYFLQLIEPSFRNELSKSILKWALNPEKSFPRDVLFAFDGFDEILDVTVRNTIISLMKYIKNYTRGKIYITTRLHYKNILENELETLAFQFEPISDENKRLYIKRYLQDRLKLIFETQQALDIFDLKGNSKINLFTDKFLEHMQFIFEKDITTFIGTPLQLYLMMEGSVEHFKIWVEQNTPEPNFLYLGHNVLRVFENFIDRKYKIYFKKQNFLECTTQEIEREYAEDYHKVLAESLIQNVPLSKKYENLKPSVFLIGLIQSDDTKQVEFIHYTFREYFAAVSIVKSLFNDSSDFEQKSKYLIEYLETYGFKLLRNFINLLLDADDFLNIPNKNIEHFRKHFIITSSVSDSSSLNDHFKQRLSSSLKTIFFTTLDEKNENTLNFILFCCRNYLEETLYVELLKGNSDKYGTRLHHLIHIRDTRSLEILFKLMENLSPENKTKILFAEEPERYNTTILELAILKHRSCHMLNFLLRKLEEILESEGLQVYLRHVLLEKPRNIIANNRSKVPVLLSLAESGNKEKMARLLEKIEGLLPKTVQKKIITQKYQNGQNILYAAATMGHIELVKTLLIKISGILSVEEQKRFITATNETNIFLEDRNAREKETILHLAANRCNTTLMTVLLNKIETLSAGKELITAVNTSFKTVFHVAFKNGGIELINLLLAKMNKILSNDEQEEIIFMQDVHRDTLFHIAAQLSNSTIMKNLFKKCHEVLSPEEQKEIFRMKNISGQNIIHIAANHNKIEILKTILTEMNEILTIEEQKQFIIAPYGSYRENVFHLVAKRGSAELMNILLNRSKNLCSEKRFLLTKDSSLNTAFDVAFSHGGIEIINLALAKMNELLSNDEQKIIILKQNVDGNTVFHFAAQLDDTEIIKKLFKKCREILSSEEQKKIIMVKNTSGQNIIYLAANCGQIETLKTLLTEINKILSIEEQKQFFITVDGSYKENVFYLVAKRGDAELMNILLNKIKELCSEKEFQNMKERFRLPQKNSIS